MKITNYLILAAKGNHDLSLEIQEYIKNGWQPFGNLSISFSDSGTVYNFYQPMVKYAE